MITNRLMWERKNVFFLYFKIKNKKKQQKTETWYYRKIYLIYEFLVVYTQICDVNTKTYQEWVFHKYTQKYSIFSPLVFLFSFLFFPM